MQSVNFFGNILVVLFYLFLFHLPLTVFGDCRVRPIAPGYHYGIIQKTFVEANSCCKSKNMTILDLNSEKERSKLRQALLCQSFRAEPIGPSNGVFVRTPASNIVGYYPPEFAYQINAIEERNDTIRTTDVCSIAFLSSPRKVDLKILGVPCNLPNRYVCERKENFDAGNCTAIKYTELTEDKLYYSHTKLEWSQAGVCCEVKGGELYRYSSSSEREELYKALTIGAIIQEDSSISFWTGGYKKLERRMFTWSNYEPVMYPLNYSTEFCLQGYTKWVGTKGFISLKDVPCETKLNFVCLIPTPKKCYQVRLEDKRLLNITESFRKFYYSGKYKLPWSEAVSCCRKVGLRLLTMISPQDGNMFAKFFQESKDYRHRHQGFRFGLWTSGRQHEQGIYEFVSVGTKLTLNRSMEGPFFIPSSNTNGTCLQLVLDVRNSFFLNNIPCKSIRSFICESVENSYRMKEIGNKYYQSTTKASFLSAYESCSKEKLNLLYLKNSEEMSVMSSVIPEILKSSRYPYLWSSLPEQTMSMELNPKPRDLAKFENLLSRNMDEVPYGSTSQTYLGTKMLRIRSPVELLVPQISKINDGSICTTTFASENGISSSNPDFLNCSTSLHYICERQDLLYGKCNHLTLKVTGKYLISETPASWMEAIKCCREKGRTLLALNEGHKGNAIYQIIKEKYQKPLLGVWTAGTNSILTEKWIWTGSYRFLHGNKFYHNYTSTDSVTEVDDDHECLEAFANTEQGLVLDHDDCNLVKPYICDSTDLSVSIPCYKIRFERLRRTDYYVGIERVRWAQAQECCKTRGMTLAELSSGYINGVINQLISERSPANHKDPAYGLWIGLTSHLSNHTTFTWIGSKLNISLFDNFSPTLPQLIDPNISCVVAFRNDTALSWKNVECWRKRQFICELKNSTF